MAEDMYKLVRKKAKPRSRWSLRISVAVAVGLIGIVVALCLWAVQYRQNYREFVYYFSSSNMYAAENLCFHADVQGELIRGKRDNVEKFYSYIVLNGSGRVAKSPEGEPAITIDFGDGGSMKIWDADYKKFRCYLLYEHEDGFSYGYYGSGMTVSTMAVNYLNRRNNAPWNGKLDG